MKLDLKFVIIIMVLILTSSILSAAGVVWFLKSDLASSINQSGLLSGVAMPEGATPGKMEATVDEKCLSDKEKFCKDFSYGKGAGACLYKFLDDLTPACRAIIRGIEKEFAPCAQDKMKFCKNEKFGTGKVKSCLLAHSEKIASSCLNYIKNVQIN